MLLVSRKTKQEQPPYFSATPRLVLRNLDIFVNSCCGNIREKKGREEVTAVTFFPPKLNHKVIILLYLTCISYYNLTSGVKQKSLEAY